MSVLKRRDVRKLCDNAHNDRHCTDVRDQPHCAGVAIAILSVALSLGAGERSEMRPYRPRPPQVPPMTVARFDPNTGLYRVEMQPDGFSSMTFSHPWSAARTGCIIAGEIVDVGGVGTPNPWSRL